MQKGHFYISWKPILHKHILNRSSQSTHIDTYYSFVSNLKGSCRDETAVFRKEFKCKESKWTMYEIYWNPRKTFFYHNQKENEWKIYPLFVSMSDIIVSDWFDVFVAFCIVYSIVHMFKNALILLIFCIDILMPCT